MMLTVLFQPTHDSRIEIWVRVDTTDIKPKSLEDVTNAAKLLVSSTFPDKQLSCIGVMDHNENLLDEAEFRSRGLNCTTPHLNTLPIVVTKPGRYRSRDGRLAVVHEITEPSTNEQEITAFRVKGTIAKRYSRGLSFNTWHVSGRVSVMRESVSDIVGEYE